MMDHDHFDMLGLTPSYDTKRNTFSSKGIPVRHVSGKRILARQPYKEVKENEGDQYDTFSGFIDGVTGELLNGTRCYVLTGELYEGPFGLEGARHGEGAIVKNVHLPSSFDHKMLCFTKANFFGSYHRDQPAIGMLVTDMYTYRGHFKNGIFHGENCELIHSSGYSYRGEFQDGLFHGLGQEIDPFRGKYTGEFKNGKKNGIGTFKAALIPPGKKDNDLKLIRRESNQEEQSEQDCETVCKHVGQSIARYKHSGMYKDNRREGEGTEWTPDGNIYTGQFLSDRKHGKGILQEVHSGNTAEGCWAGGIPVDDNEWRILYPSGDMYAGYTVHFVPEERGAYKYQNGDMYSGNWSEGRQQGTGAFIIATGSEFLAEWNRGIPVNKRPLEQKQRKVIEADDRFDSDTPREKQEKRRMHLETAVTKSLEFMSMAVDDSPPMPAEAKFEPDVAVLKECSSENGESSALKKSAISCELEHTFQKKVVTTSPNAREKENKGTPQKGDDEVDNSKEHFKSVVPDVSAAPNEKDKILVHAVVSELETRGLQKGGVGNYESSQPRHKKPGAMLAEKGEGSQFMEDIVMHIYPNNDVYLGALDPKTKDRIGYGVFHASDRSTYTGEFQNNKRHGYGRLKYKGGSYSGDFRDGDFEGKGTLILAQSSFYDGHFKGGKFEGQGIMRERDGACYVGQWKGGVKNGHGTEKSSEGSMYHGMYENDKRHGKGVLLDPDGLIMYVGEWCDGQHPPTEASLVNQQSN